LLSAGIDERNIFEDKASGAKDDHIGGRPRAIPQEKMDVILEALNNGMSKAAVCRTFEVKQSTLIDSLNRINSNFEQGLDN